MPGRMYDSMSIHFGQSQLFVDNDTIPPGTDFVNYINSAVAACDVLVAVVGRQWTRAEDAGERRRLDNPHDFVRIEVEAALQRGIAIIPVLVQGATMPTEGELPGPIARLARFQAVEVSDTRWAYDMGRLIKSIERVLAG